MARLAVLYRIRYDALDTVRGMANELDSRILSVRFYSSGGASEPVRRWLEGLSDKDRHVACEDIATLQFGWLAGMPHCRSIAPRPGLWEVKSHLAANRLGRILVTRQNNHLRLLHAFVKTADEAPDEDLDLAVRRQKETEVTAKKASRHIGSSFDEFLREEGLYEQVSSLAWKRVLAWQIAEAMQQAAISKTEMAQRMKTSRTQVERLLDPDNANVLLETIQKAATVVGKRVVVDLEDAPELTSKGASMKKKGT